MSFNWYRLAFKLPVRVAGVDANGTAVELQVGLDDYAEVWVEGELARPFGGSGGSVIAGWNAQNRVLLSRRAHAGQEFPVAIFGINGPISDSPSNYIFVREARFAFGDDDGKSLYLAAQTGLYRLPLQIQDIYP